MKRTLCILIFLIIPLSCTNGLYDILDDLEREVPICVDPATGVDSGDGRGWDNAYQTIEYAVDHAGDDDEIWVAKGNYVTQPININRRVRLYGGFKGTESSKDERDSSDRTNIGINADPISILSSDIVMEGFQITGIHSPSAVVLSLADHSVIFKNCNFVSNGSSSPGSAISCTSGTVKLVDCSFKDNYTNSGGSPGGAVWCNGGTIIINGCFFDANRTQSGGHGGAIYCTGAGRLIISDTVFSGNYAVGTSVGGAIWCSGSSIVISDCVFSVNHTARGGAIYCGGSSNIEISNTTFTGNYNEGNYHGGAISADLCTVTITGSDFVNNKVTASGYSGGAIYGVNSDLEITGSGFYNNKSDGGYGGGIYSSDSKLTVRNSIFNGNTSLSPGGAISVYGEDASGSLIIITNTIFADNKCTAANFFGGGVYCARNGDTPEVYILNCTFYNNTGTSLTSSGSLYLMDSTAYIYNSLFFGNSGNYSVDGGTAYCYNNAWDKGENSGGDLPVDIQTLTDSPFVSAADLRLASGVNVCVNHGYDLTGLSIPGFTMPSTDLAGKPRIAGGIIDIGAYERQ